uniref:Uncharacterized protein n=1 Tax=Leersia perrieri TaxID=77586 RepID=A0A0D9WDM3_9ORYZ
MGGDECGGDPSSGEQPWRKAPRQLGFLALGIWEIFRARERRPFPSPIRLDPTDGEEAEASAHQWPMGRKS